jgi:hypothetical protein
VNGSATIALKNATLECISGRAIATFVSASGGTANVTLDSSTIQNTDIGIYAPSGTVKVTNSTINYNFIGVWQQADVTYNGTVDLSGGGNTIICSSNKESSTNSANPGIDVYNSSTAVLKADNVSWDTASPDYYSCLGDFSTCTCLLDGGCTTAAGLDDMDAVEDSTNLGGITTTGNAQSPNGCH